MTLEEYNLSRDDVRPVRQEGDIDHTFFKLMGGFDGMRSPEHGGRERWSLKLDRWVPIDAQA